MLKDDLLGLKSYMEGHHKRLDLDIKHAQDKGDNDNVQYYKGAQNATNLFIVLIQDILNK